MAKLKGVLLTEGMHGMISQVEGLAKALDIDFTHHKVELNHFWKLIPPNLSPISQSVFQKINHDDFDVIISCGRKSVIPSIHLKKTANKKVFNIHIQDPKVDLNNFDFIVPQNMMRYKVQMSLVQKVQFIILQKKRLVRIKNI